MLFIAYQVGRPSLGYLPSMNIQLQESIKYTNIAKGVIAIIYSHTGGLKSVLLTGFHPGQFCGRYLCPSLSLHTGLTAVFKYFPPWDCGSLLRDQPHFQSGHIKRQRFPLIVERIHIYVFLAYPARILQQRFTTTTDGEETE